METNWRNDADSVVIFASVSANRCAIIGIVMGAVDGAYAVNAEPAAADDPAAFLTAAVSVFFGGFAEDEVAITSSTAPRRLPMPLPLTPLILPFNGYLREMD